MGLGGAPALLGKVARDCSAPYLAASATATESDVLEIIKICDMESDQTQVIRIRDGF